jgi:hypothetical protein
MTRALILSVFAAANLTAFQAEPNRAINAGCEPTRPLTVTPSW